jgi:hypothetical protein
MTTRNRAIEGLQIIRRRLDDMTRVDLAELDAAKLSEITEILDGIDRAARWGLGDRALTGEVR